GRALLISRLHGLWRAAGDLRTWRSLPALLLVPIGLLSFLIYAQVRTGDFLASPRNEYLHWGRRPSYPWDVVIAALRHPTLADPTNWNFWILNSHVALLFLLCTLWAFRRLPMTYALYTLLMVLVPLASSELNSISRYYLTVFPVLMLLGLWSNGETRLVRHAVLVGLFASLQAVFMIFFVLALPAIA